MTNEDGIDERKVATKGTFKSYDTVFDFGVRFGTTRGIEG